MSTDHTPMTDEEIAQDEIDCDPSDTEYFEMNAATGWPRALAELRHRDEKIKRLQDTIYSMNQSHKDGIRKASAEISQQCNEEISRRSNRLDAVKKKIENMSLANQSDDDLLSVLDELYRVAEGTS